jgi:hypothetical protein
MAARRLIILMVVLLAISTLAAALLPTPRTDEEDTTQAETTQRESQPPRSQAAGPAVGGGQLRQATIDTAPKPTQTVPAKVGDQLTLIVTSRFGDLVEVPAFGLFKAVAPAAPARFELLLDRAGVFAVRTVDGDLLAGRICATRGGLSPRAPRGRSRARACAPRDRRGRAGSARSAPQP